jgi:hypothetical protein
MSRKGLECWDGKNADDGEEGLSRKGERES